MDKEGLQVHFRLFEEVAVGVQVVVEVVESNERNLSGEEVGSEQAAEQVDLLAG